MKNPICWQIFVDIKMKQIRRTVLQIFFSIVIYKCQKLSDFTQKSANDFSYGKKLQSSNNYFGRFMINCFTFSEQ